ncbi:MAG: RagB/SusD family nutrient uptake outer membrane protein [Bacteroidales bacterium]|nr:RagB/SusD family nutrient uptake outer membrane protein [Bacteroidales bacterium]MCI1786263.1 RagB/SusD family nutrient uptake outer membrane protein [Bacteroidales bacterium]
MKKLLLYIVSALFLTVSCTDMDLSPKNMVTDDDLLSNQAGMSIYMATLYSKMPWEDFKYMAQWGITYNGWLASLGIAGTGDALDRDGVCTSFTGESTPYWTGAFELLRNANHLLGTLPDYRGNYAEVAYNEFLGQAYFVRAYVFYQMARRFGGIPLVTREIDYPSESDSLEVPRSSEKDTWDQILSDFDKASELLPETPTFSGTANKYAALAFKAEAMLYAGSVAKYNETVPGRLTGLGAKTGVRVIGFASDEWQACSNKYFSEAYKAAREVMKSGKYSLYKKYWAANDAEAQYKNMVAMWKDLTSPEDIMVRQYEYPTLTHGLDAYCSPFIFRAPLCSGSCPTLDFIEMFDGFDRYSDGYTIRVTDGNSNSDGNYLLYDSPMDLFANAEPRLRAYVIFPGDVFKSKTIEIRGGIYTGSAPVKPLLNDYSYAAASTKYQNLDIYTGANGTAKTLYLSPNSGTNQETVTVNGVKMNAAGANGPFYDNGEGNLTGLYLRKYLDEDLAAEDIGEGKSSQPFILMRYADVLLAAAESGVELSIAGVSSPVEGDDMLKVATTAINDIRERAGAVLLTSSLSADNDSRDIVRKERRKELAFEHKTKWDLRRWRVLDENNRNGFWGEQRDASKYSSGVNFRFKGLYPFYSSETGKYFFDESYQWVSMKTFSYNVVDYYFGIPGGEVSKSSYIDQQPNR